MTLQKRSYEDKVWPREVPERGWLLQRGVARVMNSTEGVVSPQHGYIWTPAPWEKCWW